MKNDFDMIIRKFSDSVTQIHLYPIGDTQIGSANFDESLFFSWRKRVLEDPIGYVVIVGDMLNNGLKTSKTNTYKEVMSPSQAKEWIIKEFRPIKDRLIGIITGNHELRSVTVADTCPLYDICLALGVEDLYRENAAFMKISLGKRSKDRQISYGIVLGHGVSHKKTARFITTVDGADIFITGHTHDPQSRFPAKIVMDMHNERTKIVGICHIIVPSFDRFGGYTLRDMYEPQDSNVFPIIKLDGTMKRTSVEWLQNECM